MDNVQSRDLELAWLRLVDSDVSIRTDHDSREQVSMSAIIMH